MKPREGASAASRSDTAAIWRDYLERLLSLPPWAQAKDTIRYVREQIQRHDAVPRVGWTDGLDDEIDAERDYLEAEDV